jgi:hypothetical protein
MNRFLIVTCAVVLTACGGGSSGGVNLPGQGPPSAQAVAASDSDFSGMHKCPESGTWDSYLKAEQTKNPTQYDTDKKSGTWDSYLKAEQTKNPTQYDTDKKSWDDLKAAGADDSYIAVYAQTTSDCGQFAAGTPSSKVAYVYAIRFKDTTSASTNFKTNSKAFHLSDSDVVNLKAAGGIVQQGAATGLGDNSVVVSIAFGGTTVYVAFWQKKQFEVALVSFNLPIADGPTVTAKISGRIP